MSYFLAERILNPAEPLASNADEFMNVRASATVAIHSLAVEEKYGLVLENYREFEMALLALALDHLLFRQNAWTDHVDSIRDVNRVLMNLLASIKAYLDQVPQHLKAMLGQDCEEVSSFRTLTSREYDEVQGYRLVAALRNHAQHGDFPVHSINLGSQWIGAGLRDCSAHTAKALADRDQICANTALNAKVRAEVAAGPEKIDLRPPVCQTMAALARIHNATREWLDARVQFSETVLAHASDRFKAHAGRDPIALCVVRTDDHGNEVDSQSIFSKPFERRQKLAKTNSTHFNLEKHFVSGRALERYPTARESSA